MVLTDHMDIIYQIRQIVSQSKIKMKFIFTHAAPMQEQDESTPLPTQEELLMRDMHVIATTYYHNNKASVPCQNATFVHAQKVAITHNGHPIISDIHNFCNIRKNK